jgi:hypothetical protein
MNGKNEILLKCESGNYYFEYLYMLLFFCIVCDIYLKTTIYFLFKFHIDIKNKNSGLRFQFISVIKNENMKFSLNVGRSPF